MSEITRSELEGQSIELLPAREEMRFRLRLNSPGTDCGAQTANCSIGSGTAGNGFNQTASG